VKVSCDRNTKINDFFRNECDPALALLSDYVTSSSLVIRRGCALGLGIAYCGSNRDDVIQLLIQQLQDPKSTMEEIGCCALALGLIAVGSCNGDVTTAILQILIEKSESNLKETHARFLALALGLCYLQKQDLVDTIIAALEVVPEPLRSFATILVEVCAYAGTGNVLKIQKMLHICSEKPEEKEDEEKEKEKEKEKG
jgi:26S proteasome regulatory subunit N1